MIKQKVNKDKYRSVDGKIYNFYKVYDNGDIEMRQFIPAFMRLQDDEFGILSNINFFYKFILDQQTKLAKNKREVWGDINSEMRLIDKTYDDTKFTYAFNPNTGIVKKTEIKSEKEVTKPTTNPPEKKP